MSGLGRNWRGGLGIRSRCSEEWGVGNKDMMRSSHWRSEDGANIIMESGGGKYGAGGGMVHK